MTAPCIREKSMTMSEPVSDIPVPDIAVPEEVKKEKGLWEKTRKSLIERLNNWEDQRTWNEFYQTYWRLIFSVASKAGLTREESFDVIQETIIAIARQVQKGQYDPRAGSFKAWLLQMTRWRILDVFRARTGEPLVEPADRAVRCTGDAERGTDDVREPAWLFVHRCAVEVLVAPVVDPVAQVAAVDVDDATDDIGPADAEGRRQARPP